MNLFYFNTIALMPFRRYGLELEHTVNVSPLSTSRTFSMYLVLLKYSNFMYLCFSKT